MSEKGERREVREDLGACFTLLACIIYNPFVVPKCVEFGTHLIIRGSFWMEAVLARWSSSRKANELSRVREFDEKQHTLFL